MKRTLQFLALSALLIAPATSEARLGLKLSELKDEMIMKEFALSTLVQSPTSVMRTYEITPIKSKVAGLVMIKLQFDTEERLIKTELWISKEYRDEDIMGVQRHAALFLQTQVAKEDKDAIMALANETEYRVEMENYHILGEKPEIPAKPTVGYQAIMGRNKGYSKEFKKTKLTISQAKESKKDWTRIELALK